MVGRQKLSGKQEEIRFKVCTSLCKNIIPETDHLKRGAYFRLPCRALIVGDHLNADAITAAIVANNQGTPARLVLIVVSFRRRPLSPLIPPSIDRVCRRRPSIVHAVTVHQSSVPSPSIDRSCRHLSLTAATTHSTCPSNRRRGPPRPRPRGHR
jgi:hypothetical protein